MRRVSRKRNFRLLPASVAFLLQPVEKPLPALFYFRGGSIKRIALALRLALRGRRALVLALVPCGRGAARLALVTVLEVLAVEAGARGLLALAHRGRARGRAIAL